jgi:hypothetical protein
MTSLGKVTPMCRHAGHACKNADSLELKLKQIQAIIIYISDCINSQLNMQGLVSATAENDFFSAFELVSLFWPLALRLPYRLSLYSRPIIQEGGHSLKYNLKNLFIKEQKQVLNSTL